MLNKESVLQNEKKERRRVLVYLVESMLTFLDQKKQIDDAGLVNEIVLHIEEELSQSNKKNVTISQMNALIRDNLMINNGQGHADIHQENIQYICQVSKVKRPLTVSDLNEDQLFF